METGLILSRRVPSIRVSTNFVVRHICALAALLLIACASSGASEVVVYTQVWKGKEPSSYTSKHKGKGYILIDFENRSVTRISTENGDFDKSFRIENFTAPVMATFTEYPSAKECLAVQATRRGQISIRLWERFIYFKGKTSLQQIGPSQQKRVPKLISGLRRMTEDYSNLSSLEEDSFTASFSSSLTNDANGNGRTLQQQVELLAESLVEAGYRRTGTE